MLTRPPLLTRKEPTIATAKPSPKRGQPVKPKAPKVPRPTTLLKLIEASLDADKAEEVVTIDLADKTSIADFMVIATGRSQRQVAAMTEHLVEKLKAKGLASVPVEGLAQGDWVLVDAGDVIVHLFRPEIRTHYSLEKMWGMPEPEPALVAVSA